MQRVFLLISLALSALLGAASWAPATPLRVPPPLTVAALYDETEDMESAEGEEEFEWCEEEPECEEEEEVEATDSDTSSQCPLRSANAHAATKNDKLKLTIGYTTSEPFDATFEIKQGAIRLASLRRHLGRSGVLRFNKVLGEHDQGRLVIRIKLPKGRAGCPSRRLVLFPR